MPNQSKVVKFRTNPEIEVPDEIVKSIEGGNWVVMSAEIPPEDESDNDVVRIKGMKVTAGIPIQAQHLAYAPDGSPTTIGVLTDAVDGEVAWKGRKVPAKFARFDWAPTELARKYQELWPRYINSVSIGAFAHEVRPIKGKGREYIDTEVYELSVVTFPANPAARFLRARKSEDGTVLCYETVEEEPVTQAGDSAVVGLVAELKSAIESMRTEVVDRLEVIESAFIAEPNTEGPVAGEQKANASDLVKALNDLNARLPLRK